MPEEVKQEEPASDDELPLNVSPQDDLLEKNALRTIDHIYSESREFSKADRRRVRFLNWSTVLQEFYRY